MNKITFKSKQPKRSGTYLVKYENGDFDIINFYYSDEGRDWWIHDYPNCNVSTPYDGKEGIEWGPKLE